MKTRTILVTLATLSLISCGGEASSDKGQAQGSNSAKVKEKNSLVDKEPAGPGSENTDNHNSSEGGANIKYLRENHDHYSHHGDIESYPVELHINGDQVYWDIEADTEQDAEILAGHIEFMMHVHEMGSIPRAWDKLFVLEAFLHDQIHTEVEQKDTRITVYKTGDTECAYELVKVHASAVSNEFFATGDISADHSYAAEQILSMDICAAQREEAEAFIAEHWEPR